MPDAPTLAPSLDNLRSALTRAETQLLCDEMIDSWPRQQRETAKSRARVTDLKNQIARIEETL